MTKVPLDVRKELWKLSFAKDCISTARNVAIYLIEQESSLPEHIRTSLSLSVHVHYGRPFTMNYGVGKLSSKIISPQFENIHEELMRFRNQVFAHVDPKRFARDEDEDCINVAIGIKNGQARIVSIHPEPQLEFYRSTLPWFDALLKKIGYHLDRILNGMTKYPEWSNGLHYINLSEESDSLWKDKVRPDV